MTVKSLLLLLLGGVLMNNCVLQKFLGVTPFLGYAKDESRIAGMGLAVTAIMILTAAVTWPLQTFVLEKFNLVYLQTLLFVAVILILVYLAEAVIKALAHRSLGVYFPLIALNGAVLGLAVNSSAEGYGYIETLVFSLGTGLGFLLGMFVFAGVQSRINEKYVPKAFRGLPVSLLALSILSLALFAF